MALFEWGVAFHDLDFEAIRKGEKSKEQVPRGAEGDRGQGARQIVKDYIAFPCSSAWDRRGDRAALEAQRQRRPPQPKRRLSAGARRKADGLAARPIERRHYVGKFSAPSARRCGPT